jgi:FkbM family methyltransferase
LVNSPRRLLIRFLGWPPIARLPVRVRGGIAEGAWWSFFPWTAYWRGTHEPEVQARLLKLWDWTGKHVWDLGSHYGLFTVGLGRRVGPSGSVAAFEPNPVSFARLQLHVRRNRLSWVKPFRLALSDSSGLQRFFAYDGLESTTTHLAYEDETWNEQIPTITVESRRLDDMVAAGEIVAPDFIKIDIEGHGHKALAGAADTVRTRRPTVLFGLHSDLELAGIRAILDPLGYRYSPIAAQASAELQTGFDYLAEPTA